MATIQVPASEVRAWADKADKALTLKIETLTSAIKATEAKHKAERAGMGLFARLFVGFPQPPFDITEDPFWAVHWLRVDRANVRDLHRVASQTEGPVMLTGDDVRLLTVS